MAQLEGVRLDLTKPQPLSRSIYWAEQFLNKLGGDFSLIEITESTATLGNISSCAGMCGSTEMCNSIERAVNTAIKVFDSDLKAGFSNCAHDESDLCRLEIYLSD